MTDESTPLSWEGDNLLLRVRVQPRASKDEIVGPHGNCIKIRITAPPVEGRANAHLIRFLASSFGVPRARVRLLGGEGGREKRFRIEAPRRFPARITPPETGAKL